MIGRVFHELKLIEQWGSGIGRVISACQQAGLPQPVWEELGTRFRVTMRMQQVSVPLIDAIEDPICVVLSLRDGLRSSEIAEEIGLTTRATRNRLKKLVEQGLVVRIGTGPTDPKSKYFIAVI